MKFVVVLESTIVISLSISIPIEEFHAQVGCLDNRNQTFIKETRNG